ncbi:MAG: hypothetical protein ACXVII_28305 [Solirubrobacteraceae bacterium]
MHARQLGPVACDATAALARALAVPLRAGRFVSWFLKMMIVRFFAPADSRRICAAVKAGRLPRKTRS